MYTNGEYLLFQELVRDRREKIEKELDALARFAPEDPDDDLSWDVRHPLLLRLGSLLVTIGRKMQPADGPERTDDCGYVCR